MRIFVFIIFDYKGCGGNLNRFFTKEQCEEVCQPPTTSTSSPIESSTKTTTTTTSTALRKLPAPPKYIIKTKKSCRKPRVRTLHQSYFYMLVWVSDRMLLLSEVKGTYNCHNSEPTILILISSCHVALQLA